MKRIFFLIMIILKFIPVEAIETKIIYKIQNKIITNIDIKNEFKYLLVFNSDLQKLDKDQIFIISKDSVIARKIKETEVSKFFNKIEINEEFSTLLIKNLYESLKLKNLDEFILYLSQHDLKIEDIKERLAINALWNELIVNKYASQIEINEEIIKKRILIGSKNTSKEYLLSEIIYVVKKKEEIETKYIEIKKSISEIGFENTAALFSIADSSKTGGEIGWINENSLNPKIKKKLMDLNIGNLSTPLILSNGILILKVNNINFKEAKVDYEAELKKAINYERNRLFSQYSKIYFNKVKKKLDFDE